MTLTDKTKRSQTESLAFELELPHPPQKVWRALTEPELLAQWLLPVVGFQLEPGVAFTFKAEPQPGWDGRVRCEMLEVTNLEKLRYRWVVGDKGDMDTIVTFTLTPTPSGTRLSLVHSGFKPDQKLNFGGARYGWRMMGGKLEELLAGLS